MGPDSPRGASASSRARHSSLSGPPGPAFFLPGFFLRGLLQGAMSNLTASSRLAHPSVPQIRLRSLDFRGRRQLLHLTPFVTNSHEESGPARSIHQGSTARCDLARILPNFLLRAGICPSLRPFSRRRRLRRASSTPRQRLGRRPTLTGISAPSRRKLGRMRACARPLLFTDSRPAAYLGVRPGRSPFEVAALTSRAPRPWRILSKRLVRRRGVRDPRRSRHRRWPWEGQSPGRSRGSSGSGGPPGPR